jgi:hypothetical protein
VAEGVKLTLELDSGESTAITLEGEPIPPETRLEVMQGLCKFLDMWATERDKDKPNKP